jgi:hypothetical protein
LLEQKGREAPNDRISRSTGKGQGMQGFLCFLRVSDLAQDLNQGAKNLDFSSLFVRNDGVDTAPPEM